MSLVRDLLNSKLDSVDLVMLENVGYMPPMLIVYSDRLCAVSKRYCVRVTGMPIYSTRSRIELVL